MPKSAGALDFDADEVPTEDAEPPPPDRAAARVSESI